MNAETIQAINQATAQADAAAQDGSELQRLLGTAEDGEITIQTNKGAIVLHEFDVFAAAECMAIIGRAEGVKQGLAFLAGKAGNPEALAGLFESGDTLLEIIALSAGYITRKNKGSDAWRDQMDGLRARYLKELVQGVYSVNEFFFMELAEAFDLSLTQLGSVILQTIVSGLDKLTTGLAQMTPPEKATEPGLTSPRLPITSDGAISLADLKAMDAPAKPS